MRGHKKDANLTRLLHDNGYHTDGRSGLGYDAEMKPHLLLRGEDKSRIRLLIFKKFNNRCCVCDYLLSPDAEPFAHNSGAWHHTKKCDCVGCGELRCDTTTGRKCHAHRTVGFRKVAARKEFSKLYPTIGNAII